MTDTSHGTGDSTKKRVPPPPAAPSNFLVARLKREKKLIFLVKKLKKCQKTAILGQKTIKIDISDLATRKFEAPKQQRITLRNREDRIGARMNNNRISNFLMRCGFEAGKKKNRKF